MLAKVFAVSLLIGLTTTSYADGVCSVTIKCKYGRVSCTAQSYTKNAENISGSCGLRNADFLTCIQNEPGNKFTETFICCDRQGYAVTFKENRLATSDRCTSEWTQE